MEENCFSYEFLKLFDFSSSTPYTPQITMLELEKMKSYSDNLFHQYEGKRLEDMVSSIKKYGIRSPIIVWKKDEEYIILSGHNRKRAAQIAGLTEAPVIINENLTDKQAFDIVVEMNLNQQTFSELSHSQKADCLSKHYQKLLSLNEKYPEEQTDSNKKRVDYTLGLKYNISRDTVARYIKIASMEQSLINLLDSGNVAMITAYYLAFTPKEMQNYIANLITNNADNQIVCKLDSSKAENLKKRYTMNENFSDIEEEKNYILNLLNSKEAKIRQIKFSDNILDRYFNKNTKQSDIQDVIVKALDLYFKENEER